MQSRHQVLAITGLWLILTAYNFVRVVQIAQIEGTPLLGAEQRIYEKIVLVVSSPLVRPYLSMLGGQAPDLIKPYAEMVAKSPADSRLRCHYAVLLAAYNQRKEAFHQLDLAQSGKHPDAVCGALQKVLHPPKQVGPKASWTPQQVRSAEEQLKGGLSGWMLDFALQELYEDAGLSGQAAERKQAVDRAARRVLQEFCAAGVVVLVNFLVGVCTIVVYLAAGRHWDLRSETERSSESEHGFNAVAGWAMVLVFPVTVTFISVLIHGLVKDPDAMGPFFLVAVQCSIYLLTLIIIHFAIGGNWRAVGVHASRWQRSALVGFLVFCAGLVLVYSVALLIAYILGEPAPSQNPVFLKLSQAGSVAQWFVLWLLVGLLGPIFEEILFRGVIYSSMRTVLRPALAIPLNGIVFSAVHGDVGGMIPLALLGALLAWTFERTRSVVASSVTHCLWNTQTFFFTILLFT